MKSRDFAEKNTLRRSLPAMIGHLGVAVGVSQSVIFPRHFLRCSTRNSDF